MIVHTYKTSGGKDLILDFIDHLPKREKLDALGVLESLEETGLEAVVFKHFEAKIWEIKFYKYNRLFYVVNDGFDIYLLHVCKKQKNKAELKDKRLAFDRAKELGEILGKKFI